MFFCKFLNMFDNVNKFGYVGDTINWMKEMKTVGDLQKSIWTMWEIGMERLSIEIHYVLQSMQVTPNGWLLL